MNYYQTKTDTTIIDTGLAAAKTYLYKATIGNKEEEKSKELQISTLPTTSNNFTWQKYTFGDGGINIFRDVAIIDENDIWVVGQIEITDTSANGYTNYNAVHWDGQKWELKRIYYYGDCSAVKYPPLTAIWAFSKNNIVVSNGGSIGWFDGKTLSLDCGVNPLLNGAIKKIWGSERADLFIVGNKGSIAHYDGRSWSKIESGTTTNINDVWGYYNQSSNEEFVLCVASNILHQGEYRLLAISDGNAHDTLNWTYNNYWLKTVWFKDKYSPIYIGGGGIKLYKRNRWEEQHVTNNFVESIRGSEVNNIFAVGDNGFVGHFNGIRWHVFNDLYNNSVLLSASVKNKTTVMVGYTFSGSVGDKAIIIIGKRND